MSRFKPIDHHDCIIASESVIVANVDDKHLDHNNSHEFNHNSMQQLTQSTRNGLFRVSTQQQQRTKYLSYVLLLGLLCLFCLISTSVIDVLQQNSSAVSSVSQTPLKYSSNKEKDSDPDRVLNDVLDESSKLGRITLDNVLQNELLPNYFNGSWTTGDGIVYYDAEYNLCLYNSTSKVIRHLIRFPYVLSRSLKGTQLSHNLRYLLWSTETIELFRYSKLEKLKIYDIVQNSVLNLFDNGQFSDIFFQFGLWGPYESQLVFSYQNDLYYKHSANSETMRLTVSGVPGSIFNGQTDWLYEEELLNSDMALWFAPNGQHLAYIQINSTLVDFQSWNRYGDYYNTTSSQYPSIQSIRYPKPGTTNPQVSIFIIRLHHRVEQIHIRKLTVPASISRTDYYITKVSWLDNDRLMVAWTVRNQTYSILTMYDRGNNWIGRELFKLDNNHGWVDGFEHGLLGNPSHHSALVRIPKWVDRERGEYFHVASIDIRSKNVTFLTDGKFDVVKLLAYSPISNEVFYASTIANHPEVQHIMKVSMEDSSEPICLTCYLGNSCRHNEAYFNRLATRFVLECNGYEIPRIEVRNAQTNELIETLEENWRLFHFLRDKSIPRYEKLFIKLSDKDDAVVELILPPSFDEEARYPLLIELYGAPASQMVRDKYEMNHWSSYLVSEKNIIYARVDVRGSANQGVSYMNQLYKNVGHLEVDDLIDVVWFLRSNLTYIDPNRIALWGWSYGGYMSLMSLIREFDNRLFSCAIAVAPVSNWMYYDSAYSERYLGIPNKHNLYSYEDSNLLENASLLRNKKFMIIFGTSDDNVHMQHSLHLIRKLNDLNIDYDVQIYPDDNHYLLKSSSHLYHKMTNYVLKQCFHQK